MPAKAKQADGPPPDLGIPPEGSHKFLFRNGSVYEGDYAFMNGRLVRHGHGVFRENLCLKDPDDCPGFDPVEPVGCEAAQVFEGEWEEDRLVEGRITFADGSSYSGRLDASGGYVTGGVYVFANGSSWCGGYQGCVMHGDGVFTDRTGTRWKGRMEGNSGSAFVRLGPCKEGAAASARSGVSATSVASTGAADAANASDAAGMAAEAVADVAL